MGVALHHQQNFTIDVWLKDGDLVYLDDADKVPSKALQAMHTPGHTLDSISLIDREEKRIFVGDLMCKFAS